MLFNNLKGFYQDYSCEHSIFKHLPISPIYKRNIQGIEKKAALKGNVNK